MVKNHMKAIAAPTTWPIRRKEEVFVPKPNPGSHGIKDGVSLITFFKSMINVCKTKKEVSNIIHLKGVLVNGRKVDDKNYNVGLYDVVKMVSTNDSYRIYFTDKGKLFASKIDAKEENLKPSKIIKKTVMKGAKLQLNMSDGINHTITKGDYAIGDTIIFETPKLTVKEHIKLENGVYVQIVAGKYLGLKGEVVDIIRYESGNTDLITFKTDDGKEVSTLKSYAFVLGKKKSAIFVGE